jgi:hypothetical protein
LQLDFYQEEEQGRAHLQSEFSQEDKLGWGALAAKENNRAYFPQDRIKDQLLTHKN